MKTVFLATLFLLQQVFGSELPNKNSLCGVKSITIFSQIYPQKLDIAFKAALITTLSQSGKIIKALPTEANSDHIYSAISNDTLLKLSLHNWITETSNAETSQFKVQVQIVLECFTNSSLKNLEQNPSTIWIEEEDFDFASNEQKLIEIGKNAVEKLTIRFMKEYQSQNPDEKSLTFFVF